MRSLRAAGVTLALAGLALAACSSDGSSSAAAPSERPLRAVERALTEAGAGGTITGTLSVGATSEPVIGEYSGTDLTRDGRGKVQGRVPFDPMVPLDVAWRDGRFSSVRPDDPVSAPPGAWPASLLLPIGPGVTTNMPVGLFTSALEPVFPPALVRTLADRAPVRTTKLADGGRRLVYSYRPSTFPAKRTVTLTVGKDARLERVRVVSESGITTVLDYRITPNADGPIDVTLAGDPNAIVPLSPTGPYEEVRSGTIDGSTWKVLRAPGVRGTRCWRVETTPPLVVKAPNFGDARCLAPATEDDELTDQVVLALTSDGTASPAALVLSVPADAKNAKFGYPGGRTVDTDIVDGTVAWVGSNNDNPVYLSLTVGGTKLECATGAITTAADLRDPQLADVRLGLPWTCTEP